MRRTDMENTIIN